MISASKRLSQVERVFDPYQDRSSFVRLDRNEDPVGWDEDHFAEWLGSLNPHDLAAYADSTVLTAKLADWLGVRPECLYITAGSDAAIKNVFEAYVDPGDRVVLQDPGWRMYEVYGKVYGAQQILVPYGADLGFDTGRILNELSQEQVRMVLLANPNQPTGTLVDESALTEIVAEAERRDTLVVIDEAYYLFTPQTALDHMRQHANVIVVRTFSKAFGLAGLRIGYCVAAPERIRELMLLRPVTDANSLALKCAEYVLEHADWMEARIADFVAGREFLYEEMRRAGIAAYPSHTNFLLIRCGSLDQGREALNELRRRGYLLKGPFSFAPLQNCIRISIGPLALMQRFWADCGDVLKAHVLKI